MERFVYLDNNATTQVAPEVVDTMVPFLSERWGNPSSAYLFGHQLGNEIAAAREKIAGLINADPRELLFTSCGTESINTAIHSALATQPGKRHVVTTAVEHSATLKYCDFLRKQGCDITVLAVDPAGLIRSEALASAIRPDTALVSVIWANNETGLILPLEEIAALCRERNVLCHADGVQSLGKVPVDVHDLGLDFMSFSAHKLHAPKGIGLLYVKRRTKFQAYVIGGGQEKGRRGGTENVANMVAFGRAAELAAANLQDEQRRVRAMRDRLESGILNRIPGTSVNGDREQRLPNTTNIAFEGVEAEGTLLLLDQAGVCASSGSACTTGSLDPSHVLTAMGCSAARARSSVRFSLGLYNTDPEIDYVLEQLPGIIQKLRINAPLQEPPQCA